MRKENFNSIIIAFVLAMIGTILAYYKGSSTGLFGLPQIALLIIAFIISFLILIIIFKFLIFGLILKKRTPISGNEIPKATSNVKNTYVPGSTSPQKKEVPMFKPQPQAPEPVEEVHKDVSIMVDDITKPPLVSESKDRLIVDNTINQVREEERKTRREEIVKEAEGTTLVDLSSGTTKPEDNKTNEVDSSKLKKLSLFEDLDKK